jgi:hypothetical protein
MEEIAAATSSAANRRRSPPNAVALTISDMLFWLEGGRWRLNPDQKAIAARSLVEALYCPDGYDLPDCWTSHITGS